MTRPVGPRAVAGALAAALAAAGCGDGEPRLSEGGPAADRAATAERTGTREEASPRERRPRRVRRARCPEDLPGCRTATGTVLYVEAVDPDGDGDAHYVLSGGDITFPGVSVIDVPVALRPRRLPRPGERVSAAGPVFRGSYGQRQIEAVVVHHER